MLKKTFTYTGYDDKEHTEDVYFNLSKSELMELEMTSGPNGYSGLLAKIVAEEDSAAILATFKDIIAMSVGRRSEDGKRFIKSDEIMQEFQQSPAYDQLLMSFFTDVNAAVEFVTAIVPADMAQSVKDGVKDVQLPEGGAEEKEARYLNELSPEQIEALPWETFKQMQGRTSSGRMSTEQVTAAYKRQLAGK